MLTGTGNMPTIAPLRMTDQTDLPDNPANNPPNNPVDSLVAVVDDHRRWLVDWHRAVFFGRKVDPDALMPTSFLNWCGAVSAADLAAQPAVDRLVALHEQLHRAARLVLLKVAEGARPTEQDYESVVRRFEEFMGLLRRVERAFAVAASGIDPLTGLRSRSGMIAELEREANRIGRNGKSFCLAVCDVDHFKSINDRYGHDAGDRVLAAVAASIGQNIRSFDEAYRMGGEEFLICLKDADLADGYVVIERLRAELAAAPVGLADGARVRVTASFGLAAYRSGIEVGSLIAEADRALYIAKKTGRNRVVRAGLDEVAGPA